MTEKDAYQQKLQAKLEEWRAEIDRLKARAKEAEADAQVRHRQEIRDLQAKREALKKEWSRLQQSSGDAWQEVKSGADKAWSELSTSIQHAWTKLKE